LFNLYTNIQLRVLKGVSQEKWDTLFTLFSKYGPIPRLLFQYFLRPDKYGTGEVVGSLEERILAYDHVLEGKIQMLLKIGPHVAFSTEQYGINSSHTIFMMRPCKHKTFKYVSVLSILDIATPYIGYRIGVATLEAAREDARMMYQFLMRQAETKTYAGLIFENRMHLIFQHGGRFEATKLGGSTTFTIEIGDKPYHTFAKVSELGSLLRKQPRSQSIGSDKIGVYFRPQQGNLCSVDSFAITKSATTNKPVLVLFQMTVSTSHPVKAHGLASIWAKMPASLKRTPPMLVFVVPEEVATEFSTQTITPSVSSTSVGDTPKFDEWDQYVLAVSDETLWKNIMPDREEPVADPGETNAHESHLHLPRSVMPLPTTRQKAKQKATPADADNTVEEAASPPPRNARGRPRKTAAKKTEPPGEPRNLRPRSTSSFAPVSVPVAAFAKWATKLKATPVAGGDDVLEAKKKSHKAEKETDEEDEDAPL
jgi:hypothetical protein